MKVLRQSRKRVFGSLIIAPMLYAVFALLASTPARSQAGCTLVSCSSDAATCHEEGAGVGVCCLVCYNYDCPSGPVSSCHQECGAQC